jgi:hypothetical protein
MKKTIFLCAATLLTLVSCNDYLDTVPSRGDNEVLKSGEQIEALFNNSDIFNSKVSFLAASGDDIDLTMEMYNAMGYATDAYISGLTFSIDDIANYQYGDTHWESEYNKVFTANLIINEIDNVANLSDTDRAQYLAQAHFMRALAYWNLAQSYCMPYSAETKDGLGLPLKQTTSYEENLERATLQQTYDLIEADLNEALKSPMTDIDKRWWVSKPAAQALLARFYLFTQDYEKAADMARQALQSGKAILHDYNTLSRQEVPTMSPEGIEDVVMRSEFYTYSPNQMTDYKEMYYSQYFAAESGIYLIPSATLTALYDQENDLRYEQFFNKNGLWDAWLSGFGDDIMYRKFYHYIWGDYTPSGPTVPEMLLTQAEALARMNKVSEAMNLVNQLRKARMRSGSDGVELTANNQQEAILQIIDERHREMPFIMRWFDIRRLAFNETAYDDVVVERSFFSVEQNIVDTSKGYLYTLPVKSRRYAAPLPNKDIARSGNQIIQNEYTAQDIQKKEIDVPDSGWNDDWNW